MTSVNRKNGIKSAVMNVVSRPPPLFVKQDSQSARTMRDAKNIDIGGVKPLVTRTEIHCGRPGNTRISAGKPTYKSQEEQYQEILELRRNLGELREEHSGLKTRNRRLEEDLIRRDRQIEQLMDPAKNDEARRKLTDKGASLVSSLKLRVSRLEATLKDKEAELAKLQASAKATALNEMKIEAETYYQEVVRLRNQLNIAQHQQQQTQHYQQYQKPPQQYSPQHSQHFSQPPQQHTQLQTPAQQETKGVNIGHWSNMRSGRDSRDGVHGRRDGGDGQESPSSSLRHALIQLEEENARLGNQVSTLTAENSKLSADMERVLGLSDDIKSNYEGMSRGELIREIERGHDEIGRLETQHSQLTDAISRRNDIAGENTAVLQAKVSELQGREAEWERERSSLRELINTLKEDRMFYKETVQKKEEITVLQSSYQTTLLRQHLGLVSSELDSLRGEVQALQQEVIALHDSQRRRNEHPSPPVSQRSARGLTRPSASSASRSGSSSDNTPARRPRPSSARPPSSGSRLQRSQKSSSEPRETPPPSSSRRTSVQQSPRKGVPPRSSSKPPSSSSSSSPSKGSVSNMMTSGNNARPSSSSNNRRIPSSSSTPKASPYASPKHSSIGRATSSSSASKTPTPSSSPRKTVGSVSPQHRVTSSSSPQRKTASSSSSVGRIPTSRSSSRTPTPSSVGSPNKSATPNRSPSKVPVGRSSASPATSPLKRAKVREESASPSRTPRSSRQGSVQDSSAEEDERVLAEILFHRETDSSGEASDPPHLARQRTVTLSQDDAVSSQEEQESITAQPSASLQRQNTITLSSKTDDEELSLEKEQAEVSLPNEEEQDAEQVQEEPEPEAPASLVTSEKEDTSENEVLKSSTEEVASTEHDKETVNMSRIVNLCTQQIDPEEEYVSLLNSHLHRCQALPLLRREQDSRIIENLEVLQSLLSSHLSRQREVNELLSQEPLLVGEGQGTPREDENTREAPDGEESAKAASKRSQNMVRQGTFNVHNQETVATIHATLDAHLTRVNKVHQFNTN
ncbi:IQ domain-containing protein E-like isoform X5 [Macrobrachium rosenbergii]|uniref:IQ domain-containing protein E-like isoform X5 n=2 Tax=Macrobrachium rosenbergii TaxID=79674 RepID=UPI0034D3C50F